MRFIALFISSVMFTGFLPGKLIGKAGAGGGLAGSLVAFFIQVILITYHPTIWADIFLILGSLILGIIFVEEAEYYMLAQWGPRRRHTGDYVEHDFNQTNIDEVHGQAIAALPVFMMLPTSWSHQMLMLLISLVAFRCFDTLKPWPIKTVEKIRGAFGIMFDDSIAGIMAGLVMTLVLFVFK